MSNTKIEPNILKEITDQLFGLIGTNAEIEITEDKDNDSLVVNIRTEKEAGLLIGNRGKTINALQTVISLIYRQRVKEWKRILVDVADWREKETARLEDLAQQTAERVKESGQPQYLYNLTASQRRIVHLTLSETGGIKTESQGEGDERCLVVSPLD